MRKWHRWLSVFFGIFLLWISVTGVLVTTGRKLPPGKPRSTAFGQNRQGIGMAFVKFGQGQVAAANLRQHPPTLKRLAMAGQWQLVELCRLQCVHQLGQVSVHNHL